MRRGQSLGRAGRAAPAAELRLRRERRHAMRARSHRGAIDGTPRDRSRCAPRVQRRHDELAARPSAQARRLSHDATPHHDRLRARRARCAAQRRCDRRAAIARGPPARCTRSQVSNAARASRRRTSGSSSSAARAPRSRVIVERREQAVHAVREDRRHAARLGRHDRQAARERLDHRRRHVVDVRRLHVDVVLGVAARDSSGATRPANVDMPKRQLCGRARGARVLRAAADERQRRLRASGPARA